MLRKEKITLPVRIDRDNDIAVRLPRALPALLLVLVAACARAPAWEWKTPPVLDEKALLAELRARGTEKGVLVNFWATW